MRRTRPVGDRFWEKVCIGDIAECWNWKGWIGRRNNDARGMFYLEGKDVLAHRVAWTLTHGPIPNGLHVCHKCDNPTCCNPAHLYLGTHQDNMRDRTERGRGRCARIFGESNAVSKLNWSQVQDIRNRHTLGDGVRALGREFGVTHEAIRAIVSGRTWNRQCGLEVINHDGSPANGGGEHGL